MFAPFTGKIIKYTLLNFSYHSCACSGEEVEGGGSDATHHQILAAREAQDPPHRSEAENCIHPLP